MTILYITDQLRLPVLNHTGCVITPSSSKLFYIFTMLYGQYSNSVHYTPCRNFCTGPHEQSLLHINLTTMKETNFSAF
jgi:hypothetical protein